MWIDWGLRTCSVRACSFISLHPHYESTTFSFAPCFTTTDQTLSLPPTHPSSYDSSTLPTLATHLLTDPSLIATPHPQQLLDLASMKRYPCLPKRPNPPKSKNEKNERKSERENDTKSKRLQLFLPTTNVFLPRTNVFTPVKSYVKSPLSPIIIAQERAQLLAQQRKSPTRRRPYRVVLYIKLKFIVKEWEMMSMGPPATNSQENSQDPPWDPPGDTPSPGDPGTGTGTGNGGRRELPTLGGAPWTRKPRRSGRSRSPIGTRGRRHPPGSLPPTGFILGLHSSHLTLSLVSSCRL